MVFHKIRGTVSKFFKRKSEGKAKGFMRVPDFFFKKNDDLTAITNARSVLREAYSKGFLNSRSQEELIEGTTKSLDKMVQVHNKKIRITQTELGEFRALLGILDMLKDRNTIQDSKRIYSKIDSLKKNYNSILNMDLSRRDVEFIKMIPSLFDVYSTMRLR